MRIRLAPRAEQELEDILIWSLETWGEAQRDRYRAKLTDGIARVAVYPMNGRLRPDYGADIRSQRVGEPVVFYRVMEDEIVVARILHGRQDVRRM